MSPTSWTLQTQSHQIGKPVDKGQCGHSAKPREVPIIGVRKRAENACPKSREVNHWTCVWDASGRSYHAGMLGWEEERKRLGGESWSQ